MVELLVGEKCSMIHLASLVYTALAWRRALKTKKNTDGIENPKVVS